MCLGALNGIGAITNKIHILKKGVNKMPKFFIMSDIHGFYDEMKLALDKAGFDPNNEEHWIITCGDHFDRGSKPAEVLRYLKNTPRTILVKGNHEQLLMDCIDRGYWCDYDWHNGTAQTICDLAPSAPTFDIACGTAYWRVKDLIDLMVDYFETKNYIFVHSWVPLISKDGLPAYYARNRSFEFRDDWREASAKEWEDSRWGNPFELAEQGLLPDKTVVFGHFHTSYPRSKYEGKPEWGDDADFSIYQGSGYIGIDGCCAYSGKVNVLVIEDDFLEV